MLPEVVKAVRNTGVEVYVDGGVRMGTDVLKALALGARAVFVGRPIIWGLAHDVSVFFNVLVVGLKTERIYLTVFIRSFRCVK